MTINSNIIKEFAFDAGFTLCGVAAARRLGEHELRFGSWLARGYDSSLGYMRRNVAARFDPAALVPGARSVVVCAVGYKNAAWRQDPAHSRYRVASYAWAPDYHVTLKGMLHTVLGRIAERWPGVGGRCFVDSAPIHEKAWAVEAGLGWQGRNSLLVTPGHGTMVLLGEIVVDAPADRYDTPLAGAGCGDCRRCIVACPAQAIGEPGVVDTRRCISRLTVEPTETAVSPEMLHGWIFGCDECQSCCPWNQRAPYATHPGFAPVMDPAEATDSFWQNITRDGFDVLFARTPLARTGYDTLKERIENMY